MIPQIFISLATEGETDNRFLEYLVVRTFENVTSGLEKQIEIAGIQILSKKEGSSVDKIIQYACEASTILCVHADADDSTDAAAFQYRITPGFQAVADSAMPNICKNVVAIVPVYTIEAWLLADKELLKKQLNTTKSDTDLDIVGHPENMSDPKNKIEKAIGIAYSDKRKRLRPNILEKRGQLYDFIGENVAISKLQALPSYLKFETAVKNALHQLGYR